MPKPLIAIVGNVSATNNPQLVRRAAEDLGGELARRGCRLLVYSSDSTFVECDVVRGYLSADVKRAPGSVEVRYPTDAVGLFPGEKEGDDLFIRKPLGREWEATFYPSLAAADGLLIIGGGYTTKIAGLIAAGAGTALLALAGFGGAAQEVWETLRGDRHTVATDDELNLMAQQSWHSNSASQCVTALLNQRNRHLDKGQRDELRESERRRTRTLTILALVASALFVAVLAAMAEAWQSSQLSRALLWMLFGAPALAGASGAAIRVVWDNWQKDATAVELRPTTMTVALGFWASGVAGALFVLPQVIAGAGLLSAQASRLVPFAALVGLLAGLTLDKVFPKLTKTEVPINTASIDSKQALAKPAGH